MGTLWLTVYVITVLCLVHKLGNLHVIGFSRCGRYRFERAGHRVIAMRVTSGGTGS